MQHPLSQWAACILIGAVGLFFLIMTYGALLASKKSGKHISGVPCCGGILLIIAFLLSPCKWLAFLGLLDYGLWELPYQLISALIHSKRKK